MSNGPQVDTFLFTHTFQDISKVSEKSKTTATKMMKLQSVPTLFLWLASSNIMTSTAFVVRPTSLAKTSNAIPMSKQITVLQMSTSEQEQQTEATSTTEEEIDYETPEDAVIVIKPKAMNRLRELQEKSKDKDEVMVLRMGVRNGGCSGLSYVMDFSSESDIQDDDAVDEYPAENLKCVVDAKSMLYLYGLELDYSEELIGGGFKFFNPNAEEACGCGSSFGV